MEIKKFIWNEEDFENMGWHDCHIYGMAFSDEDYRLLFDIDYIFKWVKPKENETYYKFWVSPATLIFKRVRDLKIDFIGSSIQTPTIQDIEKIELKCNNQQDKEFEWIIETIEGSISFKSTGFYQFIRKQPKFIHSQNIGLKDRGGLSFDEVFPNK